jgi:hypothetical protein
VVCINLVGSTTVCGLRGGAQNRTGLYCSTGCRAGESVALPHPTQLHRSAVPGLTVFQAAVHAQHCSVRSGSRL